MYIYIYIFIVLFMFVCMHIYIYIYVYLYIRATMWYNSSNVQYGYPHVFPILLFMENMFFFNQWMNGAHDFQSFSDIPSAGQKKNADAEKT